MSTHRKGTTEEWLVARMKLLEAEKNLIQQGDAVSKQRQELPWVRIEKDYQFDTDHGKAGLADLFRGRSQLIIYHFMFGPDFKAGCPTCSSIADGFNGIAVHLANHDVMFWAVSLAPLEKLLDYRRRMEWKFPWASSFGNDFNFDFRVGFTEGQMREGIEYNYKLEAPYSPETIAQSAAFQWREGQAAGEGAEERFAGMSGTDVATYHREKPGMSAFALEDKDVYHCYSTYARGVDPLWGMYQWLDRAPKGRNEADGPWWRRHDEYGQ